MTYTHTLSVDNFDVFDYVSGNVTGDEPTHTVQRLNMVCFSAIAILEKTALQRSSIQQM